MKKLNLSLASLLLLLTVPIGAELFDPLSWVKSQVEPAAGAKGVYVTFGEDKRELLIHLKEEEVELKRTEKQVDEAFTVELERVGQQIAGLKERIRERKNDFLQKKLTILNELHQVLIDRQLSHKQEIASLEQEIKTLEEYLRDPDFKGMTLDAKSFYSFENLQEIVQKISDQDDNIGHLDEQKNSLSAELENRKKQLEQLTKDLKNKEREQKEGMKLEGALDEHGLDAKQRAELLDLTVRLLTNKKLLTEQKIHEIKRKQALLEIRLFIERAKRKVLNDQRMSVKEGLHVEESDVQQARTALERKRQIYLEKKDARYQERKNLEIEREKRKEVLEALVKKLGITIIDLRDLDDLPFDPSDTEEFVEFSKILNLKEALILIDKHIDLLDAQIHLMDAQFDRDEIAVDFIDSWHKRTMRKLRSEAEVEEEINKYYEPGVLADQEVAAFIEKRNIATNFLTIQNKVFDSLKNRLRKLEANSSLFRNQPQSYNEAARIINGAMKMANSEVEMNRQIIEVYSNIIQLRSSIKHQISGIISELQSIGLRPPHAITLEGLKNIPSDFVTLWGEIWNLGYSYFKGFTVASLNKKAYALGIVGFSKLIFVLLALFLLFLASRALLPILSTALLSVSPDAGNFYFIGRFASGAVDFIALHVMGLFIWAVFYGALSFDVIVDIFPRVIFYLISIPYFLILSNRFLRYMDAFNEAQDYFFISRAAVNRLYGMVTVLLYATVIVFFFRQAFMLASYSKSELPTILLTIYSIIVRIMLISLIRKEDLLDILPTQGEAWEWIRGQVERHFYPIFAFLVMLIVMSEPHVGYGKYVSYVLWGVVGTTILIRALLLVHQFVKRYSTVFFFSTEGDMQRERFMYAKSAYGLFVIGSFVVLAFFVVMMAARIWGYTITLNNVSDLLHTELFSLHEGTTDRKEITVISFLQMLGFIFGSFVVASAINTFVIRRIFDLLIVDQGVQYTVSTIMHYLIVALVIMIGLQRIGLSYVILLVFAPVLLGIGWSMRDYANDFVSYFIILVQRPFKIGDFVMLEGNVMGVVRKITPRSIIIREKNSVNVLVPNSKVINSQITNWNYSRSFTSFPDIHVAVPFSTDPLDVKTLIIRVLDANMNVLKNPKPVIRLDDFSEGGFVFMVRGYVSSDNVLNMFDIASDVRFAITKAMRENNITVVGAALIYKEIR